MIDIIPEVLDFRITSSCNMHCPFCFGPATDKSCLNLNYLLNFFHFMKEYGLKYVVLTGGEPTVSAYFKQVVEILKSLELQIALSTNGTFWSHEDLRFFILTQFNWIAFPVESTLGQIHNQMRCCSFDHYALIQSILPKIRETTPNLKIKIGTVVTKSNYSTVPFILDCLPILPDTWKLFQLSRSTKNMEYYEDQQITTGEFNRLVCQIKEHYYKTTTKIYASCEADRDNNYLFLEPDGKIMVVNNGVECIIGDYRSLGDTLINKISESVDYYHTNQNFYNSFGLNLKNRL